MKWITEQEVEEAAKKSPKAALKCSQKHWKQLSHCTEEQLRSEVERIQDDDEDGFTDGSDIVDGMFCSLCERYGDCTNGCESCPIMIAGHKRCADETYGSQWRNAETEFNQWYKHDAPFKHFQDAAKIMYKMLRKLKAAK